MEELGSTDEGRRLEHGPTFELLQQQPRALPQGVSVGKNARELTTLA